MKSKQTMMRYFSTLSFCLMLGASMSACAGFLGFGGTSWKEEVLLHDGSKIIVKRSVERGGRHEIGQRGAYIEESLSFTMLGTNQTIKWEDHYSEDIGHASLLPMVLDIYKGNAYLVADTVGCLAYNKWRRPNPPYVVFQYQGKEWKRISLQELPVEIKLPNLVISSPDDVAKNAKHGLLSAEMIKQENEALRQPEYHTILREPLSKNGRDCIEGLEEIRTGDGWMSIDWFSSRKTHESCMNLCTNEKVSAENCPCNKLFKAP